MGTETKRSAWQQDKNWSDKFLPEIKQILGLYLIGEASKEDDEQKNTDLIFKEENVRIACRVRSYYYFTEYPNQFTIRFDRPSGTPSELTKIISGLGKYFFYGFSDKEEQSLIAWSLCDLCVFRLWHMQKLVEEKGKTPGIILPNKDGSSYLVAYEINWLPENFIIARKQ